MKCLENVSRRLFYSICRILKKMGMGEAMQAPSTKVSFIIGRVVSIDT